MIGMERIIDQIAAHLNMDPVEVRQVNYYPDYRSGQHQRTPYGQVVRMAFSAS